MGHKIISVKSVWDVPLTSYNFLTDLIGTELLPLIIMHSEHIKHKLNYSEDFSLFFPTPFN